MTSLTFNADQRMRIEHHIEDTLKIIDPAQQSAIVDEIERTGKLRTFAYGSLRTNHHTDDVHRQFATTLHGWKKGYVCMDSFYRGTKDNPGLTLGLDQSDDPEAKTSGEVLETDLDPNDLEGSTMRVLDYITKLADREFPPDMPIYAFGMVETTAANGVTVKALGCIADKNSHMYVGDKLTLAEKAVIIATAVADARGADDPRPNNLPGKRTDLQYLQNDINTTIKNGETVDPEHLKLNQLANAYRGELRISNNEYWKFLVGLETHDLHPDVYKATEIVPNTYAGGDDYLHDVQQKLGTAHKFNMS